MGGWEGARGRGGGGGATPRAKALGCWVPLQDTCRATWEGLGGPGGAVAGGVVGRRTGQGSPTGVGSGTLPTACQAAGQGQEVACRALAWRRC